MSDSLIVRIDCLEKWRDGNGKPGAAAIIADHEKRILHIESDAETCQKHLTKIDLHHAAEKQVMQESIEAVLRKRARSFEGMLRAGGPYAAAAAAIISAWVAK